MNYVFCKNYIRHLKTAKLMRSLAVYTVFTSVFLIPKKFIILKHDTTIKITPVPGFNYLNSLRCFDQGLTPVNSTYLEFHCNRSLSHLFRRPV